MQTTINQGNNGRAAARDYIENQQIFNNINLSKPIEQGSIKKLKARSLANYNKNWFLLKDIAFYTLFFICGLVILPIENKPSTFLFATGTVLCVFLIVYYRLIKSIEIHLDKIKIDDKLLHFKDIEDIKSENIKFPVPDNIVTIYLQTDSDYPSYKLYLNSKQKDYLLKVWNQHLNEYISN
ncbi:hypothetical protein AAX29_01343 [Aliarcobacter thereius]|uniref:Uncharacterized protein n=1 Tax=Aliarcobacter thereius TaxID=544718 RepID=A0A1C0B6B7_9BACT|nr:hypothetical protein [Aliarcobacter thereius]OCL98833.1 hypothetical protein AAX29_01343 [Aliarcobacter thereius]